MPTGAAGGDIDFLQRFELGFTDLHLVEEDGSGILRDAAEGGVTDGAGLLVNFLEHEVLEATLLRHDGIPGDALGFAFDGMAVEVGDLYSVLRDYGEIAIAHEEEVASVVEECGYVAGYEVFIFAEADYGGRSVAGGDNFVGLVDGDDDQGENSGEFFYGFADGFFE